MEPKQRQVFPKSDGPPVTADHAGDLYVLPHRPVTLSELSPDPATGRYTATKPGNVKTVDTKAQIAEIRADKAKDAEASASAKKLVAENADKIAQMRAPKPPKKKKREEHLSPYKQWRKDYLAKQK